MNYDEIYRPLSRTSFSSKMYWAFYASVETMSIDGQVDSEILRKKFLPDEIETFVLNSVVANEYNDSEMKKKQFCEIMTTIRNYQPPDYYEKLCSDSLKWVLPTAGAVQFESQQYLFFRLYRHHFLFSFENKNINVDKEFCKKFRNKYDEYAAIAYTFHMVLSQKDFNSYNIYLEKVGLKAPWFLDYLKIEREQYIDELSRFAQNAKDYRYCLRPSYSFPFIEYDGNIYLPTPHLIIQSITTAMMNRLTFENESIREKIGKNACEAYLFKIVRDSGLFDEVKAEYEYKKGKKTLDVLTRKENVALLIDSKLFSPKVSLRTFDEEAYREDISRIVKSMKQAYLHAHDKYNKEYCPFEEYSDKVYALVVVYQEGYLDYDEIFRKTAEKLAIDVNSSDYTWLCYHIGFTDVATLERFMLSQTDILPEIMNRNASLSQWFTGKNNATLSNEIKDYQIKIVNDAQKVLNNM